MILNSTEEKSAVKVLLHLGNVSATVDNIIPTESYLSTVAIFCFSS